MTKGSVLGIRGDNLLPGGSGFCCHFLLKNTPTTGKKSLVSATDFPVFCSSKFNTNTHNLVELPARTVAPAHWSGPLVVVR